MDDPLYFVHLNDKLAFTQVIPILFIQLHFRLYWLFSMSRCYGIEAFSKAKAIIFEMSITQNDQWMFVKELTQND